ncbi:MAG: hypothetical protein RR053_06385 [Evtepia sp.]
MNDKEAADILKNNVPKECKMVNGRYQGGFDDWESDLGKAIKTAISALEERDRRKAALERELRENGR